MGNDIGVDEPVLARRKRHQRGTESRVMVNLQNMLKSCIKKSTKHLT